MHLLAQASTWVQPNVDYHALAPEIVLAAAIVVLLLVDLFLDERQKWATSSIAGLGLLASFIPVLTLAVDGGDRSMFDGGYVVDNFSLVLKALFLLTGYVVVLHVDELHRRGRLLRGRVLHAACSARSSAWSMIASSRDLVCSSSPSSCSRSPPTCSPPGASATPRATKRA